MPTKDQLIKLVNYMREYMTAFPDLLTQEQRDASGKEDTWAAKDNLFHSLYWSKNQLEMIERFERGADQEDNDDNDFEAVNKKIFQVYKDRSWQDARTMVDDSYQGILDYLDGVDDDRLLSIREGREQPIWRDIIGSYVTHPMIHLWEQLIAAEKRWIKLLRNLWG